MSPSKMVLLNIVATLFLRSEASSGSSLAHRAGLACKKDEKDSPGARKRVRFLSRHRPKKYKSGEQERSAGNFSAASRFVSFKRRIFPSPLSLPF